MRPLRSVATIIVLLVAATGGADRNALAIWDEEIQGSYVSVQPILGRSPRPIRVYLSTVERRTLERLEEVTRQVRNRPFVDDSLVTWHIESVARVSPTMILQRRILFSLREMLEGADNVTARWPVDIVIGRTQSYILGTLRSLGCEPNLTAQGGQILMGAAVCGRRFIVSNISGYLFLTRPGQTVTPEMERRAEGPLFARSYKLVARDSSALAHEWMHIYRAAGLEGRVAPDEPEWFSEGFAELWAYVAKVREYRRSDGFLRMHVTRLRDFSNWADQCPGPLSRYRTDGNPYGCEYHLGMLAMEYLVANYGGLEKTAQAFREDGSKPSFAVGFEALFGVSLDEFEVRANRYIDTVRAAARRS
jgi:hypothetical protein